MGTWIPACDWQGCRGRAIRYLQLGYRDQDQTTMFVCDEHYLIGLERLAKSGRKRNMPLGSVVVESVLVDE